jgi:XRE family transcriptional regulator, fatty acid utilization regulator
VSTRKIKEQIPIDWKAVGRRIRELRGFDTTQSEFARRVGVSQGYLSSIERGEKEVGPAVLLAIGREFEKSVDWLLTGSDRDLSHTRKVR